MALFSKQTSDLPVLARWTVPAPAWRDFVAAVRAFAATPGAPKCSLQHLDDPVGDGIEVRVHEDAVFVGADSLYLIYQDEVGVRMRQPEDWLEFGSDHYGWFFPVPDDARYPQSERVCDHFVALWEREAREAREARARPVWHNKLLDFVEGHFVVALLLFFFVLLPGFSLLLARLFGD